MSLIAGGGPIWPCVIDLTGGPPRPAQTARPRRERLGGPATRRPPRMDALNGTGGVRCGPRRPGQVSAGPAPACSRPTRWPPRWVNTPPRAEPAGSVVGRGGRLRHRRRRPRPVTADHVRRRCSKRPVGMSRDRGTIRTLGGSITGVGNRPPSPQPPGAGGYSPAWGRGPGAPGPASLSHSKQACRPTRVSPIAGTGAISLVART